MAKKGRKRRSAKGPPDATGPVTASPNERGRERGDAPTSRGAGGTAEPQRTLPLWLPAVLYAAVTTLLFRKFVFSDAMLFGADTNALGYAARAFYADAVTGGGVFPLWNPHILGGTPFLESLAGGDSLYPTALLLFVMEPYRALGWKLVIHVFLAGVFMFGWVRVLGASRAAALLAGLAYLLAPYMVSLVYPGHDGKIFVTALTPLMFWAAESSLVRRGLSGFVAVSLVVGLVILTTHFQMAYFLFGGVGIYYALRCVQIWRSGGSIGGETGVRPALLKLSAFLVASVLGAGIAGVQLLPAVDYVTEFSRRTATTTSASTEEGVAYSSSWSLHPEEIAALAVPEFVGNSSLDVPWGRGTYWGRNPGKYNHEYVGLMVLLLATLSFFGGRRPWVRWSLAGIGVVAVLYTLGLHTPVWRILYALVPGVSLFRAPSTAVFLFGFAATTLAALGVDRGLEMWRTGENGSTRRDARRASWALVGWVGALIAATALSAAGGLGSLWTTLLYRDIDASRIQAFESLAPFLTRGLSVAVLLAGGTAASWWGLRRGWLKPSGVVSILGLLIVLDLFRIGDPFIRTQDFDALVAPDPNVQFLAQRADEEPPFRVLSFMDAGNVGQDVAPAIHGLELAAGHHPNDLARYRDLVGMIGSGVPANFFDPATGEINSNLTRVLNVRYLLWPQYRYTPPVSDTEPVSSTTLADGRPYSAVYPLDDLPRARLVGTVRVVPDESAVSVILSDAFDPATEVLLAEPPPEPLAPGPVRGTVEWVERGVNEQFLRVDSDRAALLVISDNWFPAWHARVDGVDAPVLRANYALRAVPVPAGQSEVHLYYRSNALRGGLFLSLASLLVVVAVAAVPVIAGARRGRNGA